MRPLRSWRTLLALRALRTLRSGNALITLRALWSRRPLLPSRALWAGRPLLAFGSLRTRRASANRENCEHGDSRDPKPHGCLLPQGGMRNALTGHRRVNLPLRFRRDEDLGLVATIRAKSGAMAFRRDLIGQPPAHFAGLVRDTTVIAIPSAIIMPLGVGAGNNAASRLSPG